MNSAADEDEHADQIAELVGQLEAARRKRELSQRTLSTQLGLTPFAVRRWETGLDTPSTIHFVLWARTLGHSMALLDPAGEPTGLPGPCHTSQDPDQHAVESLIAALRTVREDTGFTQHALARELGVSGWTLSMWELTNRAPRLPRLIAWASRLGCRVVLEPVPPGDTSSTETVPGLEPPPDAARTFSGPLDATVLQ